MLASVVHVPTRVRCRAGAAVATPRRWLLCRTCSRSRAANGAIAGTSGPAGGPLPSAPAAHYVRFVVADCAGVLAAFAAVLASHGINVDAMLQEPGYPKSRLPFVMTLEACTQEALSGALDELATLDVHEAPLVALPILPGAADVAI